MRTERWDPRKYYCVYDCNYGKHAKGCRDPKQLAMRRDPKCWDDFYSVECAALLPDHVKKRLIRCVPTDGVEVPEYDEDGSQEEPHED